MKKDSVKKHLASDLHLTALDLENKAKLGATSYNEQVLNQTPIGQGLMKMADKEKEVLMVCFNTAYYLVKQERPFSDYKDLLNLQFKNGVKEFQSYLNDRAAGNFMDVVGDIMKQRFVVRLSKANYYSLLTDGSTDAAVIEEELEYVLFLDVDGRPKVKFMSIETPKHTTADGLKDIIEISFNRIGIENYSNKLYGFNVDGASVNMGLHRGLGVLLREQSPWLLIVHCFNHRFELAIKDSFQRTFFNEIETFLVKLFYLYKKSSKRLRELREFSEIYEKSIPKPAKVGGTRWIAHKFRAMAIVLQNYGVFITHLESLAQTDSQALKKVEIEGFARKWQYAKFPLHLAIYLDVLTPLKVLSISMQKDEHDPVFMLRRMHEFTWTMSKLQILVQNSIDGTSNRLTNYTKFLQNVTENDDGDMMYQNIKLKEFENSKRSIETSFTEIVTNICHAVEDRFGELKSNPVYNHLVTILDVSSWPEDEHTLMSYGDDAVHELSAFWKVLLENNNCNVGNIPAQWDILKNQVKPSSEVKYLDVWAKVFTNLDLKVECKDMLHIIELLLITPFANVKLERMFSTMNRVKTDFRNKLSRE